MTQVRVCVWYVALLSGPGRSILCTYGTSTSHLLSRRLHNPADIQIHEAQHGGFRSRGAQGFSHLPMAIRSVS
ncbi:hypothetical protein BKA82DRAFT_4050439 [Pisolithus tinctorius]|nr:hypothetical protein BKA82DRAFT_4050439 [Pisolithus tinctorius]